MSADLGADSSPTGMPLGAISRADIQAMRRSYGVAGLSETDILPDPIAQFALWLKEAAANPMIVEANAMVLSTNGADGPQSRTVLLKDVSADGFSFYTNYQSRKARAIAHDPRVSILFPWYAMERQVLVGGTAEKVSPEQSSQYFHSRPWSSQIGAWASSQSEVLESRQALQDRYDEFASKYPEGSEVPLPPHWGGYLITPQSIEFWQGRYSRLHDRLHFSRNIRNNTISDVETSHEWNLTRLHP